MLLIYVSLNSCSNSGLSTKSEFIDSIDSIKAKFIIAEQDTIRTSENGIIYYSILLDSIGRRFFVEERGCSVQHNNSFIKIGIRDTILIKINRYTYKGQIQIRSNDETIPVIKTKDGYLYEVYETAQLCKHKLIE